jgi:hypothetical protein
MISAFVFVRISSRIRCFSVSTALASSLSSEGRMLKGTMMKLSSGVARAAQRADS